VKTCKKPKTYNRKQHLPDLETLKRSMGLEASKKKNWKEPEEKDLLNQL